MFYGADGHSGCTLREGFMKNLFLVLVFVFVSSGFAGVEGKTSGVYKNIICKISEAYNDYTELNFGFRGDLEVFENGSALLKNYRVFLLEHDGYYYFGVEKGESLKNDSDYHPRKYKNHVRFEFASFERESGTDFSAKLIIAREPIFPESRLNNPYYKREFPAVLQVAISDQYGDYIPLECY